MSGTERNLAQSFKWQGKLQETDGSDVEDACAACGKSRDVTSAARGRASERTVEFAPARLPQEGADITQHPQPEADERNDNEARRGHETDRLIGARYLLLYGEGDRQEN